MEAVNRVREREGLPALQAGAELDAAARQLLPPPGSDELARPTGDLYSLLPAEAQGRWSSLQVLAAGCGGCGSRPTAADVRSFVKQWQDNPQYRRRLLAPAAEAFGFALQAEGSGRKVAVAIVATP